MKTIKLTLRLPEKLHKKLSQEARINHRSLNGEIVERLEAGDKPKENMS